MTEPAVEAAQRHLKQAIDLFTFLARAQQLMAKPATTTEQFETVVWLGALPDHPAIDSAHRVGAPEADAPILKVQRVPRIDPPAPPEELKPWLLGDISDPDGTPTLRDAILTEAPRPAGSSQEDDAVVQRLELVDAPEVAALFDTWLADWVLWADQERRDRAVREVYKELFGIQLASTDHSEEFELVIGVGCLSWRPESHPQVRRHVATAPAAIEFDKGSGELKVVQVSSPEAVAIELEMLNPSLIASPASMDEVKQLAAEYEGHPLDKDGMGDICRRLVHRLDPGAEYDDESLDPPDTVDPRAAYAPALILRRRTNKGLVKIYETIVRQLREASDVPSGILPLIDPDITPVVEENPAPGAVVSVDGDYFLPLPVNDQQQRVIDRVDRNAQTVVQGPPGTGKTHTAAALVSHLLAKGSRVLITAHTDRALREVRAKLPEKIQALAVSVIGQSRTDMAELRTAVDSISARADEFELDDSNRAIDGYLATIERLRRERAETYHRLIAIRRQEIETRSDGPEEGTLAAIAYRHLQDEGQFSWIQEFGVQTTTGGVPVSSSEIMRWRSMLRDQDIIANEEQAKQRMPDPSTLPTPLDFSALVEAERTAIARRDGFDRLLAHQSFEFVRQLPPELRERLQRGVSDLAKRATELERRQEAWMNAALNDVRTGRAQPWLARAAQIQDFDAQAAALIQRFGQATTVRISEGELAVHQQVARSLLAYLDAGNTIKTLPDGSPKIGAFSNKVVKAATGFFSQVRVNGLPAATREQLCAFIDWVDADRILNAMDAAWPSNVVIPEEDTPDERLQWHRTELMQLHQVLDLGRRLQEEREWFDANGLPVPDWNNLDDILRYAHLVEAATAADEAVASAAPIEELSERLKSAGPWPDLPAVTADLRTAVDGRDVNAYSTAYHRLTHLVSIAGAVAERDRIRAALDSKAPNLAEAIAAHHLDPVWDSRLAAFEDAWRWEMTGRWILAQDGEDANSLKVRLNSIEGQIRTEVENLAAERAWQHAVSPGRLTGKARANLTQYAQLVSALGKGTGKYAAKKRADIADAMDRCRPAVPVWIMPLYRIAEQMRVEPNLFDVVIVDEASQAGLEASFLQYLAPKIVVIGDDKQVSPSAVGVDQQQLLDLANVHLANDTYRASWVDPKRSYFDEANMRFGGRITLTEHRRCVPEIIGFSNRIAYEPEGIRLVPVRQFGADRLDPVKVVFVADGVESARKTNLVEAEAIVDQIRECLADPKYDGATMGVISLTGKEQAKLIESKLLDVVPPEQWTIRELRCGDASDFQGSERDVMFLSMVKAPSEGKRFLALTMSQYVQRFNVAASRAKDQMWVYHSMPREALTNPEDMRFQLLDYCYGIVHRSANDVDVTMPGPVPEDVLVAPFDSLFEQRVFNRIADRGYTVLPQYPAQGYKIDLVIVGATTRLAVECDGDTWHGPDRYEADLARQRELERCGWQFHRLRESLFYADMPAALRSLWDRLDDLGIHTADWVAPEADVPVADVADELPADEGAAGQAQQVSDPDDDLDDFGTSEEPFDEAPEEQLGEVAVPTGLLPPYRAFDAALPDIGATPLPDMVSHIVRIVDCEGPILGHRLQQVYVKAAGGRRVGREIARQLNHAINLAERRGMIVAESPLGEVGVKAQTYRTPSQPNVVPRELGPRTLESVPPAELAHHMSGLIQEDDSLTEETLLRALLDLLGLKRLTENARSVMSSALGLVEGRGSNTRGRHVRVEDDGAAEWVPNSQ